MSEVIISVQYLEKKNGQNFTKFCICIYMDKILSGTVTCQVLIIFVAEL